MMQATERTVEFHAVRVIPLGEDDRVRLVPVEPEVRHAVRVVEWRDFGTRGERLPETDVADLGNLLSEEQAEQVYAGRTVIADIPLWAVTDCLTR